jgi:peptidoglycan/xylan/chitin deacetylase (PgdA/CDA1 family)
MGSFAVITDFPGKEGYASWQQIIDAHKLGMEIVSHTADHFDGHNAQKYNNDFIYENLLRSKNSLAANGINTRVLVYPFGHFTESYVEEAKKAGFVMALTVSYGTIIPSDNLMQSYRIRVSGGESLQRFIELLKGQLLEPVLSSQNLLKAE